MAIQLTDAEIAALLSEPKTLPRDWRARLTPGGTGAQRRADLDVKGESGAQFRIMVRQTSVNPLNFSVVLGVIPPTTSQVFILRRYNGRHGEHTNRLEGDHVSGFHVHTATARYQAAGLSEEGYAEESNTYTDVASALDCLVADCGFQVVSEPLGGLFGGETI